MKALPAGLIFASAVTLEGLVMLMHGAPNGARAEAGPLGRIILGLLAISMFSGLTWPMSGRLSPRAPNTVLAAHAGCGILGFALFLIWAAHI